MQTFSQNIHRLTYDVIENDEMSYTQGRAIGILRNKLVDTSKTLSQLNIQLGAHLPPRSSDSDPIYKLWRQGGCFFNNLTKCDDDRTFSTQIGYTKELATSGLDKQFTRYITEATNFLANGLYKELDKGTVFQLLEKLNAEFYDAVSKIIDQFNQYAADSTIIATVALFTLASGVFGSFGIYYYIGFSQASRKFKNNNRQLVCLVFSINAQDRQKNQELNTFVESAGASIN
jgi:hypothetical protein